MYHNDPPLETKLSKVSAKSQNTLILEHLKRGRKITPLHAMGVFGVYRLAARIKELRDAGHNIETVIKTDDYGRNYAEYNYQL